MYVFSFMQWNKYFHSEKDEMYHSTWLHLVEWNISSFTSWTYLYHCTHKHSLFVYCYIHHYSMREIGSCIWMLRESLQESILWFSSNLRPWDFLGSAVIFPWIYVLKSFISMGWQVSSSFILIWQFTRLQYTKIKIQYIYKGKNTITKRDTIQCQG